MSWDTLEHIGAALGLICPIFLLWSARQNMKQRREEIEREWIGDGKHK